MDCRVVVDAAVPVYDVQSADEAVRIAISKTGEMLNPDLNYVEIDMGQRSCPHCGDDLQPAFVAADESLVALELTMKVFNVEREKHASRIARKEIGERLENIPLKVLSVEVIEETEDENESEEEEEEEEEPVEDIDVDVTGEEETTANPETVSDETADDETTSDETTRELGDDARDDDEAGSEFEDSGFGDSEFGDDESEDDGFRGRGFGGEDR